MSELWAYILGTCITLTTECDAEYIITDFSSEYVCEIHALLTTHIYQIELRKLHGNDEMYASYVGCVTHDDIEEFL